MPAAPPFNRTRLDKMGFRRGHATRLPLWFIIYSTCRILRHPLLTEKEIDMERDTFDPSASEESDLLDLGSVSEETKGRFMQPFEFGVSPTSRDEAG